MKPDNAKLPVTSLTAQFGDAALVKMLDAAKKVPDVKELAARLQLQQVQHWLQTKKSPDDVFELLALSKAGGALFESPRLSSWVNYVDQFNARYPDESVRLIATLRASYKSEDLTKMLNAAKKTPRMASVARRVEADQRWAMKDTPENFFLQLKLGKMGDDLIGSPQLTTWVSFMKEYNAKNPSAKATLIGTLTASYGDARLARMIEAAMKVKDTQRTGKRLQTEQLQRWLDGGRTPDEVFTLLKLDKVDASLFQSPSMNTWSKYLNAYNAKNPDEKTSLIPVLVAHYGDKRALEMVRLVGKAKSLESSAATLQAELMQHWLALRTEPSQVLTLLNLEKAGDDLLANPLFGTWTKYADDFRAKFPDEETSLMAALMRYYKEDDLATMAARSYGVPGAKKAAERVQAELFTSWMQARKNPYRLFLELRLRNAGDKVFESPLFSFWTRYFDDFTKFSGERTSMVSALSDQFGDARLVQMLVSAAKVPSTETLATKLQDDLLNLWLEAKRSPKEVAALLSRGDSDASAKLLQDYKTEFAAIAR
jgi:hypothetical protein